MATAPTLSIKQVQALARVSHMAVYHWRSGTSTRDPLPTVTGANARAVRVMPRVLKAWAKKYGIELQADPVAVASGAVALKLPPLAKKAMKAVKKPVKKPVKNAGSKPVTDRKPRAVKS